MDSPLRPVAAARSRPRGLRHSAAPKTPEPPAAEGRARPSPPRPRFRLKRRNASERNAPTQQFLASVAAADVPIPSIEEPQVFDDDMLDTAAYPGIPRFDDHLAFPDHDARGRAVSAPKTPPPRAIPPLSIRSFPDWSVEAGFSSLDSSPGGESSRPSTARSTQTSASLFSRYSLTSDDLSQCASPEDEHAARFGPPLPARRLDEALFGAPAAAPPPTLRKAPWTRAMSKHLWATYLVYLQDPKVTPFRVGKSGIPPSGVCMRVAREAKRSWKGSRPQAKAKSPGPGPGSLNGSLGGGGDSGSQTPTAEAQGPFVQWPHTCAATRAHLRELCKANSGTASRSLQHMARSPTPFGKAANRVRNRRSAPLRSPSVFSASDMALSLSVCTSDSMQPSAPLAQLSRRRPVPDPLILPPNAAAATAVATRQEPARLGSPFVARSYGPSSSNTLADSLGLGTEPEPARQSRTLGTRRSLGSPVRLFGSRPSSQKRRSRQSVLESRRSKRPSLGSDFWTDPSATAGGEAGGEGGGEGEGEGDVSLSSLPEFCSTSSKRRDSLFVPRTNVQELFEASHPPTRGHPCSEAAPNAAGLGPPMVAPMAAPMAAPPRLGSPFPGGGKSQSFSFPSRNPSTSVVDFAAVGLPFATLHRPIDGAASPAKPLLANRLAYIDERLRNFVRRDPRERRSESPL